MSITLRPTQIADIPFVFAAENHPDNSPYITQCPKSWHEAAIASPDYAHFIVESADQASQMVGYIVLAGIQSPHHSLEIRRIVVIAKEQGYGRQILRWIKAFAFEQLGHHRLWLDVLKSNYRAKPLYESEGFIAEGTVREGFKTEKGYESMIQMSILESEYSPRQTS